MTEFSAEEAAESRRHGEWNAGHELVIAVAEEPLEEVGRLPASLSGVPGEGWVKILQGAGGVHVPSVADDPEALPGVTPALYRETMVELMVLGELVGVLTSRVRGLTLEYADESVRAHLLLREESQEDRAQLEMAAAEVSRQTMKLHGGVETSIVPVVELADEHPSGYFPPGRILFLLKD